MSTATATLCRHCGTPCPDERSEFCCGGCQFVYRLIHESGFDQYYDLKGARELAPAGSAPFANTVDPWLAEAAGKAEAAAGESGSADLEVGLSGLSCAACVWLIERLFERSPGALRIEINSASGAARLWWKPGEFSLPGFAAEIGRFGYRAGKPGVEAAAGGGSAMPLAKRFGIAGGLALNAMVFTLPRYAGMEDTFFLAGIFELISAATATAALIVGGSFFISRAWAGLRAGAMHIDTPISLGIIAAFLGSIIGWMLGVRDLIYFDFVATFIALMLLGRLLQEKASAASRRHLSSRDAAPRELATPGGGSLPVGDLMPGTEFLLAPGSALPAAATLTGGDAEFSLEWISGEPEPRPWKRGRRVPSGAINIGRAPVALRAEEAYADSLVAKLTAGAKGRAFRHAGLERLLRWYLGAVLGIAVAGFAAWLASGAKFGDALQVFISVLVVSCPCAIGVAIPLADELAAGALRRIGLFVKSADIWAKLSGIRRIAFDKTGTLTLEVPELANPEALAALDPAARSALAALVRDSLHPAAQALREALEATGSTGGSGCATPMVAEVEETPGQGVAMAAGDGARWTLGRPGWQGEPAGDPDASSQLCRDGQAVAAFRFREALRTGAADEIAQLRAAGLDIVILSGDRRANVARMGAALGLPPDACLAELTPDQKAERVGEGTLFLGDGANDSLAFDAAACRGTPASDSGILGAKCDFFFLGRGLRAIRAAFQVAALRRRTVVNAFAFALIYNAAAVGAALAGWMSPLLAAILMPISSLVTLALVTASLRR